MKGTITIKRGPDGLCDHTEHGDAPRIADFLVTARRAIPSDREPNVIGYWCCQEHLPKLFWEIRDELIATLKETAAKT